MKWFSQDRWLESSKLAFRLIEAIWGQEEQEEKGNLGPGKSRLGTIRGKKKATRIKEAAIQMFFFTNGIMAVVVLIGIFGLLLFSAIPAFKDVPLKEFFASTKWDPTSPVEAEYGILSMIVSTMMVTVGALVIAIPIGLGVAAYLSMP